MSYQRVTMIDDLPDLMDLEKQSAIRPNGITQSQYPGMGPPPQGPGPQDINLDKYIRNSNSPVYQESGMAPTQPSHVNIHIDQDSQHGIIEPIGGNQPFVTKMPSGSPDCITIHDHIQNCPLCSKFYNNDRTVYIIAIIVLAIICIILLKKVLDL